MTSNGTEETRNKLGRKRPRRKTAGSIKEELDTMDGVHPASDKDEERMPKEMAKTKKARRGNLLQSKKDIVGGDASSRRPEAEDGGHGMIQVRAGARTVLSEKKGGKPAGRPPDKGGGG